MEFEKELHSEDQGLEWATLNCGCAYTLDVGRWQVFKEKALREHILRYCLETDRATEVLFCTHNVVGYVEDYSITRYLPK